MPDQGLPIGELSRRTGSNIETIRYYERIGLIPAPPRRGRYRSYDEQDVSGSGFVRRASDLGFPLDEVRTLLGLAETRRASCAQARSLAAQHLPIIRRILDRPDVREKFQLKAPNQNVRFAPRRTKRKTAFSRRHMEHHGLGHQARTEGHGAAAPLTATAHDAVQHEHHRAR